MTQSVHEKFVHEDTVKTIIAEFFSRHGWIVSINLGHNKGVDFEARKDDSCWRIEAKSSYALKKGTLLPREASKTNYFLNALSEILQRMDDPNVHYAIAFPKINKYEELWAQLPSEAKKRTQIHMILVSDSEPRKIEFHPFFETILDYDSNSFPPPFDKLQQCS
ncbi:MAG: hypothetical protein II954_00305 [Synergistaceae bacterium]|nr:hypothetical protein [Synergistaceae bacterium]